MMREDTSEVELESGNEDVKIVVPFDPTKINVKIVPYTVGQLVDMLNYNEILVPKYQRVPNLWDNKKKSRFIESLMLSLPIPLFYFDSQEDNKWRVVDGLQRVSTLEHFMSENYSIANNKSPLSLEGLEFLTEYNGYTWQQLPREMQRRINVSHITINLIDKGTPEEVKYNIFSRINQGGEPLKPQEIRTALFQGYRIDFLEELVNKGNETGSSFYNAVSNSVKTRRQDDLDFANRFLAFYLLGYENYEPDMDTFMSKGLKSLKDDPVETSKIKTDFKSSMDLAFEIFNNDAFRRRKNIDDPRKPINRALFEIISVNFAKLNESQKKYLIENKVNFIQDLVSLQNENIKFDRSLSVGTATKESVIERHKRFIELLKKYDQ